MAVTEVSPGHQDTVTPLLKGLDDKSRVNPAGAHDPHGPQVGWILQPRNTGQVSAGVSAPVAQERYDFRLKITHVVILYLNVFSLYNRANRSRNLLIFKMEHINGMLRAG